MKKNISINKRRVWLIVNYSSIIGMVLLFYSIPDLLLPKIFYTGIAVFFIIAIFSFIYVFGMTGLWKMTHISVKKLDERQNSVVHSALRVSYSIFSIIVLILIYFNSVKGETSFGVITAGVLLYLAHTLPAAYLAWTEKET